MEGSQRPRGLQPTTFLAALAAITFVFGVVMLATGSWAAGIVLLAVSATEGCLFVVAARRESDARAARELPRLWHRRRRPRVRQTA